MESRGEGGGTAVWRGLNGFGWVLGAVGDRPGWARAMAEGGRAEEVDLTGDNSPEPVVRSRRSSGAAKRPRHSGSVEVQLDDGSTAKVREAAPADGDAWPMLPVTCYVCVHV